MVLLRVVAIPFFFAVCCSAQHSDAVASGTVTGHVICADTNGPARIAHVVLQPVVDIAPASKTGDHPRQISAAVTATLLDGSFTIPNVAPGNYYVFVEKLGYLSPFAQLSREDLNHPKPEAADLIAKLLTPVSVAANRTTTVEVRIYKGSAISGAIRFDDGAPDANTGVSVLTKDKTGKWAPFRSNLIAGPFGGTTTDDQGRYRISGLPAGEYLLRTTLAITDIIVNGLFTESHSTANTDRYSLSLYSGDSSVRATPNRLGSATAKRLTRSISRSQSRSCTPSRAAWWRPVQAASLTRATSPSSTPTTTPNSQPLRSRGKTILFTSTTFPRVSTPSKSPMPGTSLGRKFLIPPARFLRPTLSKRNFETTRHNLSHSSSTAA